MFVSFVSSVPSKFSGTNTLGLDIEHSLSTTLQQNIDHKFYFHVFNASTGQPIQANKLIANCTFHLYNKTGAHIFKNNNFVESDDIYDWEQIIKGGNFSYIGEYSYVFQCNTSTAGGYYTNYFEVTTTGKSLSTSESILYFILVFVMLGLCTMLLYFIIILPYENERDEEGKVMVIVKLKYLKVLFIALMYPLLVMLLNLMNGLAVNFTSLSIFAGQIGFLEEMMIRLVWPFFVIITIWIIYLLVRDTNFKKLMKSEGYISN